jgi:hypothetical protein
MKIALMVNLYASGEKGIKRLPDIEKRLTRAGIEYHTHLSFNHHGSS